jgi:outer membrane biosynthesis protein TonB
MTVPAYPVQALFDGIVLVELSVTPAGAVSEAKVIGPGSGFEKVSLEAVRDWRFTPTRDPAYAYVIFGFRQPVIVQP